jgi:hypothetical protein
MPGVIANGATSRRAPNAEIPPAVRIELAVPRDRFEQRQDTAACRASEI